MVVVGVEKGSLKKNASSNKKCDAKAFRNRKGFPFVEYLGSNIQVKAVKK